jgi:hypothetical protein
MEITAYSRLRRNSNRGAAHGRASSRKGFYFCWVVSELELGVVVVVESVVVLVVVDFL